ncbi:MAG: hypothetical protein ACTSRK_10105 [Promethearchaeota archaeon]
MSEPELQIEKKKFSILKDVKESSNRMRWIDQVRGFILIGLCITLAEPWEEVEGTILFFFTSHPDEVAMYMTLYDVGTLAFLFILGLSFSLSFNKHREKIGTGKAILKVIARYGLLLLLGYVLMLVEYGFDTSVLFPVNEEVGYIIPLWDVIPSIGLVGFIALPFLFIKKPKIRMGVAYGWIALYEILLFATDIDYYASLTYHGGVFGTIFTYTAVVLIASSMAEYVFTSEEIPKKKIKNLVEFGAANLAVGTILWIISALTNTLILAPNKRLATMTYALISLGVIVLCIIPFVWADEVKNKELTYLVAFGRQPFLTYFLAELFYQVPKLLLDEFGTLLRWIVLIVILLVTSILNLLLYKKKKVVPTEFSVIMFMLVGILVGLVA